MLSKSEKALLNKIDPLFMKLLNDESLPFVFSYLDGRQIKTVGSKNVTAKMENAIRVDSGWMKSFKKDKKELLRETDYFDAEAQGGNLFFITNAKNVSYFWCQ